MEHLIQELLGLSKLDDKDGREHFEKVNLSSICQEMILSYESLAYEEGKLIEDQIAENIEILGQESQLKQLVTILLDNAIKHSLDNGKITVELLQEKKTALLRVSNPSLVYPDVGFEKFFLNVSIKQKIPAIAVQVWFRFGDCQSYCKKNIKAVSLSVNPMTS